MGATYPNRLYSMTGTLDPEGKNGGPLVKTDTDLEFLDGRFAGRRCPSS